MQLTPILLKTLEGTAHTLGGQNVLFDKSPNHLPAAREGGEGYAVPVTSKGERCILKTYFLPTPERRHRSIFLSEMRLGEIFPCFEAAPRGVISDGRVTVGPGAARVDGYLAPFVDGETLESLVNDDFAPPVELRLRLARQLCNGVRLLEFANIAHGDLSMSNVMVTGMDSGTPDLRLIDFDGFYHPRVDVIPCSKEKGGRGFGQDGYRHKAYCAMNEGVTVTSDRAAMAALLFEIMCISSKDAETLSRTNVLDQEQLTNGAPTIPAEIANRWPEGWNMVREAFGGERPEESPSPARWAEALQRFADRAPATARTSRTSMTMSAQSFAIVPIDIIERGGAARRVNLRGAGNSFASVDQRLAWLSYGRRGDAIVLQGSPPGPPAFLTRRGASIRCGGTLSLDVQSGDEMKWDEFTLTVG